MKREPIHPESVAAFITRQIILSGKSQVEIARELDYDKPNIITMFKQGKSRIPLDKVGPLAKALEIDPTLLLKKVMKEYMPDTLAALENLLDGLSLNEYEKKIIEYYRDLSPGKQVTAVVFGIHASSRRIK